MEQNHKSIIDAMQNKNNHRRIVLCGKAGSGKDFLRQKFEEKGFSYGISYTSRPAREYEVDGKDYYFLSREDFLKKIEEGFFYEYVEFNGWFYGTANWQFYQQDVFIMTPHGISKLKPEDRNHTIIFYIDLPIDTRRERLMIRNDNYDSIDRRILADEEDFKNFVDYDLHITSTNLLNL